jgi:septum formation protein
MDRLHLTYEVANPELDESTYKAQHQDPEALVRQLATAKAQAVAHRFSNALIIGSDQCAAIDGQILDKPQTAPNAIEQLSLLNGKEHRLYTGVCVLHSEGGECECEVDIHTLRMRKLSNAQISHYVRIDAPLQCAGSYKIESLGVALFEQIEGEDATAIIGLPLMRLVRMLQRFGVDMLSG